MNIIVLCGGLSAERDVSITSGKMAAQALRRKGHKAVLVDMFFGYTLPYENAEDIFNAEYYDDLMKSQGSAPLAQLVEQLTLNQWVPGSSP